MPLSQDLARLQGAEFDSSRLQRSLFDIARQASMALTFAEVQQRYVDVVMELHDERIGRYVGVDKQMPLLPKRRYRLSVHIGHRSEDSLMIGEPPPLDPLLPELEPGQQGYHLEVGGFSREDFELLKPGVERLYLARLGGSFPIYFEVRSPKAMGPPPRLGSTSIMGIICCRPSCSPPKCRSTATGASLRLSGWNWMCRPRLDLAISMR